MPRKTHRKQAGRSPRKELARARAKRGADEKPSFTAAIVGRPNVGKSTLFNRLIGRREAIVHDRPGVTRDRRAGVATLGGLTFTVFDTAGFEDANAETLEGRMRRQTEKAIADAGLNSSIPEFSSQWLTQGDIMTALAPVLFPRSDTFVIRSYGEAVNPATGATEGRAWCEATVQRVPEYFDKTQPEETAPADLNSLNQRYGRRFKVISFRWLTRSDI